MAKANDSPGTVCVVLCVSYNKDRLISLCDLQHHSLFSSMPIGSGGTSLGEWIHPVSTNRCCIPLRNVNLDFLGLSAAINAIESLYIQFMV